MQYEKVNAKEIKISEAQPAKETVYSYDFIVNKIQSLEDELAYFQNLKSEADKLQLTI